MDVADWSREDIGELYRRTKDLRSSMSAVSREMRDALFSASFGAVSMLCQSVIASLLCWTQTAIEN